MTLPRKSLLIMTCTLLGVLLASYLIAHLIVLPGFATLEEQEALHEVSSAGHTVEASLADLKAIVIDWSNWDDTYAFMADGNKQYVSSNLVPETLEGLRLNTLVFLGADGRVMHAQVFDPDGLGPDAFPGPLEAALDLPRLLDAGGLSDGGLQGVIDLSTTALAVAAAPILTSTGEGPSRGWCLMGRYLDQDEIARLFGPGDRHVTIWPWMGPDEAADIVRAKAAIESTRGTFVQPLSSDTIGAYSLLKDPYGDPAFVLRVELPRLIHAQGESTVNYLLMAVALAGVLLLTANTALLTRMAVHPVLKLGADIKTIGAGGNPSLRLETSGTNEFAQLRRSINDTLQSLEDSRRERDRLALAVEQTSDCVTVTDRAGVITYVNPAFESTFGYKSAEALGRHVSTLGSGKPDRAHTEQVWRQLNDGNAWEGTFVNLTKGGRRIETAVTISPLKGRQDEIIGFVAVERDVTSERRREEELRLSQKMEAVGRLAGGVAHDFNNLLTTIIGHNDLLLDSLPQDDVRREDVEQIRAAGERAAVLTRQLLAFSRSQVMEPRLVDLNHLTSRLISMLSPLVGEGIAMEVKLSPSLRLVLADPNRIEQVILNLVINAKDAMPHGGRLVLETADVMVEHGSDAAGQGVEPGRYVTLSVLDTGIGMDVNTRRRAFEPFFTTKPANVGTGLGLSSAYGIVKQSGGHLTLDTAPGRGATFRVYLPQAVGEKAPTQDGGAEKSDGAAPRGVETVLLAEDEPSVRAVARRILEGAGYRVLEASDPQQALALAKDHRGPIHLLLTDVMMPGMNGPALGASLAVSRPETRVLFMSGYAATASPTAKALETGAPFLEKPFTAKGLLEKVRQVLDAA